MATQVWTFKTQNILMTQIWMCQKKQLTNKSYYNDISAVNGGSDEQEPLVLSDEMKPETTV